MPSTTTFTTTLLAFGNNTGIEVPPDHVEALGAGKRPPVKVDVDGYTLSLIHISEPTRPY